MKAKSNKSALQITIVLSALEWRILICAVERVIEEAKQGRPILGVLGEFSVEDCEAVQTKLMDAFARVADEYHRTRHQTGPSIVQARRMGPLPPQSKSEHERKKRR